MRGLWTGILMLACVQIAQPQSYPKWFLEQGKLECGATAVGYANRGFYVDSSASLAARNARRNMAMARSVVVAGGQAFWTTEAGTAWMGGDFKVKVDSSALQAVSSDTERADVFYGSDFVAALVTAEGCTIPDSMKQLTSMPSEEPSWLMNMPRDTWYLFCTGVSPKYYHEASSWETAERRAVVGLAKEAGDSLAAIEKSAAGSGQEVLDEQVSVVLHDCRVLARWCDRVNGIYYVLMSVRKADVETHVGRDTVRMP